MFMRTYINGTIESTKVYLYYPLFRFRYIARFVYLLQKKVGRFERKTEPDATLASSSEVSNIRPNRSEWAINDAILAASITGAIGVN